MDSPPLKRKRSVSVDAPAPPVKAAKTHSNHLQINYLARQFPETLLLICAEDPLPSLLSLISDYDGVLQRHESMAGNLGARPLGPILIKRFERLFDGPPRVLKTHGKDGTTVGWLDVVDFARNKPEQFNLEKMRDGVRVCQFYTKQSRVEITEEDYVLIASGMPQKLIPQQPILEDEEKELGTLEILEKSLGQVVQLADQVSARARQLNHRLKNRKNAIISRREAEAITSGGDNITSPSPSNDRNAEMGQSNAHTNGKQRSSISPTSGFVAVNSRHSNPNDGSIHQEEGTFENSRTANVTVVNGTSLHGASAATRAELLSKFFTTSNRAEVSTVDQDTSASAPVSRLSAPPSKSKHQPKPTTESVDYGSLLNSTSPVPIPNTPSSLLPYVKPSPADRFDDSGPYKVEMVARMEQLLRGDRIVPPCDRCRRLHMDCLKNLTACMGCTKKHAKCSWKDVIDEELREHPFVPRSLHTSTREEGGLDIIATGEGREGYQNLPMIGTPTTQRRDHGREDTRERKGVRDEELLGEEGSDDEEEQGDMDMDMAPTRMEGTLAIGRPISNEPRPTPPLVETTESNDQPPHPLQTSEEDPYPMEATSHTSLDLLHENVGIDFEKADRERKALTQLHIAADAIIAEDSKRKDKDDPSRLEHTTSGV